MPFRRSCTACADAGTRARRPGRLPLLLRRCSFSRTISTPRGSVLKSIAVVIIALTSALHASSAVSAQEPSHAHGMDGHKLGTVAFPNSGAAGAQAPFLRGIALLHSFQYRDAADAFRDAQSADPSFALAYWGEALTNTQLLWGVDDPAAARVALARLAPTASARLALAPTARERSYGAAVEAFYADAATPARARGFADSLRRLAARTPDDLEAAAFASLAIQMASSVGAYTPAERTAVLDEAIDFAQRAFRANPDHPGAAHYLIHVYDDPVRARRGLDAARAYAKIAPDAGHAVHMPSHIFVQLGLWRDAVASNERAWASSRAWAARRGASGTALDFHSLEWLQYGYLQQGRYRAARALIDSARAVLADADLSSSTPDSRFVVARLEFALARETGDWRPAAPAARAGTADPSQRARTFATFGGYQRAARDAMTGSSAGTDSVAGRFGTEPGAFTSFASVQLRALSARARGDRASSLALLTEAAASEEQLAPVGPPPYLPTHELLGDALLSAGRPRDAAMAFERALARRPNRSAALLGLARARLALGDTAAASRAYEQLLDNWRDADRDLAALSEARRVARAPVR